MGRKEGEESRERVVGGVEVCGGYVQGGIQRKDAKMQRERGERRKYV